MIKNMSLTLCLAALGTAVRGAEQTPAAPAAADAATNSAVPKIVFETPVFDFGKVSAGDPVKHEFIFTNTGEALLVLTAVQPSCGCTTAGEWSHKVEPGKTGVIPVQFNSANYNGPVTKTVTVSSNDKSQPSVVLQIKGTIWRPIEVNPQFAVLNVPAESSSNVTTVVHIVNNMEEPLTLSPPESNNKAFAADLTTNQPGKDFQVTIRTVPPVTANVQAQISLKTSSAKTPVLNLTAWANVQPAVVVNPAVLSLPPAPLTSKLTNSVTIVNNGTNTLKLSEPTVNVKDVDVQVNESQPGRSFTATLTFPEGFQIAQGQQVELTIKSSHPQYPLLKVPVVHLQRPGATPVPTIVPLPAAAPAGTAAPPKVAGH